jgi:hypothetical protein
LGIFHSEKIAEKRSTARTLAVAIALHLYLSGDRPDQRAEMSGLKNIISPIAMADFYPLGVEEDYRACTHPCELCGQGGRVLAAAGADGDRVQRKMHSCQIKIATEAYESFRGSHSGKVRHEDPPCPP